MSYIEKKLCIYCGHPLREKLEIMNSTHLECVVENEDLDEDTIDEWFEGLRHVESGRQIKTGRAIA